VTSVLPATLFPIDQVHPLERNGIRAKVHCRVRSLR
jgi:hypothetical protein